MAQDSWKVTHNGKVRQTTSKENEAKNVISIKASDLKKPGTLSIAYTDKDPEAGWERTITLFDTQDAELETRKGAIVKVQNSRLLALSKNSKTIKVYTWAMPTDPELAARVRIRRVHLCTLVIK